MKHLKAKNIESISKMSTEESNEIAAYLCLLKYVTRILHYSQNSVITWAIGWWYRVVKMYG